MGRATALSVTPEMERVKKNQENISSASCFYSLGAIMKDLFFIIYLQTKKLL